MSLIPVLLLIHSLRPKPRQVEITNLFIWQQVLKEKRGGIRIRRIIQNLPLLLQILAVILASVALADPLLSRETKIKGNIMLVMDTSASMNTRTETGIRFDQARQEAFKLIDDLPVESKMLIISAGNKPILKTGLTDDKGRLKKIVEDLAPSDAPGRIDKAVYLALSFLNPDRDDWAVLVTDGAGYDVETLAQSSPKIRPILTPGGSRNIGITRFEFRRELNALDRYEILLEVKNFNANAVLCPIRLSLDDEPFLKKTVGLKAFEKQTLIFPYSGLLAGQARASIELNDDFPVDNQAFTILNPSESIWVLLVGQGNYFLEKLLSAYPNVRVNSVKEIIPSSWPDQIKRHDIVILDRVSPPHSERGNFLFIDSYSPSVPISKIGEVNDPRVLDWNPVSPLISGLDVRGLNIELAAVIKADQTVERLIESRDTGLMYAYEKSGLRSVFLGFDLIRSDLPLRVAFPVMMSNIFQWLYPDKLRFSSQQTQAGQPFSIYLESSTDEFSVRTPDGKWAKYQADTNPFLYTNTGRTGIYIVAEGEKWRNFAVNLTSEAESDIRNPGQETLARAGGLPLDVEPIRTQSPFWLVFLIAGFFILIMEWYFWLKDSA